LRGLFCFWARVGRGRGVLGRVAGKRVIFSGFGVRAGWLVWLGDRGGAPLLYGHCPAGAWVCIRSRRGRGPHGAGARAGVEERVRAFQVLQLSRSDRNDARNPDACTADLPRCVRS
jgi:hypothetical protein